MTSGACFVAWSAWIFAQYSGSPGFASWVALMPVFSKNLTMVFCMTSASPPTRVVTLISCGGLAPGAAATGLGASVGLAAASAGFGASVGLAAGAAAGAVVAAGAAAGLSAGLAGAGVAVGVAAAQAASSALPP